MADKYYLDENGVRRLVEFFSMRIEKLEEQLALLNKTDDTPGSIQQKINDTIANTEISDLNLDGEYVIYGGSASEVLEEGE